MPLQQKKHVFPAPVCHHPAIRKNSSRIFLKKISDKVLKKWQKGFYKTIGKRFLQKN
jgi:hypothetical protein